MKVKCDYCDNPAQLVDSKIVYKQSHGKLWYCEPCGAWVGCHRGTDVPLGRLANAMLRRWRIEAHATFDPLWKELVTELKFTKAHARNLSYAWLAKKMGIPRHECHMGMFDVDQCREVIRICFVEDFDVGEN